MDASSTTTYGVAMHRSRVQQPVSGRSATILTRREALMGSVAVAVLLLATASCAAASPQSTRVSDHRQPGDRDDTPALERALATGGSVHFPAGGGLARDGAYLIGDVALPSGATLWGEGERSVLRATSGATNVLTAMSATPAETLDGIVLRDLRIEGSVIRTGFREHSHLVALSGVRGVRIERVEFVGFAGDGIYLGAEREGPTRQPRIIRDIAISDCLFDGIDNNNRNGISVTGGSDIAIARCRFRRCTRANMPGPIDFEPDAFPFYRLTGLSVTDCDFEACGGNVGQIALAIPAIVPPPRGVRIAGNRFRDYRGTGGDIAITINRQPDAAMPSMDCLIEDNVGVGGDGGVQIFSGKGVTIRNNSWTGYAGRSFLGFTSAAAGVVDASISDRFERCGWRDGVALAVYKGDNVRLESNRFRATGNDGPGSAPLYIGTGRIRRLALVGNDWRDNPKARGLVIVERGADYLRGTTRIDGNLLPGNLALPTL